MLQRNCLSLKLYDLVLIHVTLYTEEDFCPTSVSGFVYESIEDEELVRGLQRDYSGIPKDFSLKNIRKLFLTLIQLRLALFQVYKVSSEWISESVLESSIRNRNSAIVNENPIEKAHFPFNKAKQEKYIHRTEKYVHEVLELLEVMISYLKSQSISHNDFNKSDNIRDYEFHNVTSHTAINDVCFAYSSNLIKLYQTSPLRAIIFKTYEESINVLKTIMNEILYVCSLYKTTFLDHIHPIHRLLQNSKSPKSMPPTLDITDENEWCSATLDYETILFASMDVSRKSMNILPRSIFRAILSTLSSQPVMSILLTNSMRIRKLPLPLIEIEMVQTQWLFSLCNAISETLRYLCTIRCKLLNKLDILMPVWGIIVQEANYIDHKCSERCQVQQVERSQWYTSYIMLTTTLLMDLMLELMSEMNLISLNELDLYYLYRDYVCTTRALAMEILRKSSYEVACSSYEQQLGQQRVGKQTVNKVYISTTANIAEPPKLDLPSAEEIFFKAQGLFCKSQFRYLLGCIQLNLISKDEHKYTSWCKRFENRFRYFLHISNPPVLCYNNYEDTVDATYQSLSATTITETTVIAKKDLIQINMEDINKINKCNELLNSSIELCKRARQYLDLFRLSVSAMSDGSNKINPVSTSVNGKSQIPLVTYPDHVAQVLSATFLKSLVSGSVNTMKCTSAISAAVATADTLKVSQIKLGAAVTNINAITSYLSVALKSDSSKYPLVEVSYDQKMLADCS